MYWAAALSLMHVPSGLFAQGHYTRLSVAAQNPITGAFDSDKDATRWDIQAGIAKNWFGFGNTVLFGEYGMHKNFRFANDAVRLHCDWRLGCCSCSTSCTAAAPGSCRVTS